MFRTRIGGTEIDARVRSKGCGHQRARNGRQATSEYIVRRKRWIPADSAAGSHTASEENRTQVTPTPSASPYWRVGADGTP